MEMMNVMYELATTKSALEMAETTIRKQRGKLLRKNILIAGLVWFGLTACKMLGETDKKLKEAEEEVRCLHAEAAQNDQMLDDLNRKGAEQFWEKIEKKDTCCDGCATITKKDI